MNSRVYFFRFFVEQSFKDILRYAKMRNRHIAKIKLFEFFGAIAYAEYMGDIEYDIYMKLYNLGALLRVKFDLY